MRAAIGRWLGAVAMLCALGSCRIEENGCSAFLGACSPGCVELRGEHLSVTDGGGFCRAAVRQPVGSCSPSGVPCSIQTLCFVEPSTGTMFLTGGCEPDPSSGFVRCDQATEGAALEAVACVDP